MSVLLEAKNLYKDYGSGPGRAQVLRGLDVEIVAGEILCIVGRSGIGKSTLLNLLGLLDAPDNGTLVYRGRNERFRDRNLVDLDLKERAELRSHEVGFIFQLYHLLPDLTVLENVSLPALVAHRPREYRRRRREFREKALDLLRRIGIEDKAASHPNQLSGGERQRVAIARALMNDPEMVYCDEPTGNLDTETSESIHQLIFELNRELGTTFIIVTHDHALASLAVHKGHKGRQLTMRDGVFVDDTGNGPN